MEGEKEMGWRDDDQILKLLKEQREDIRTLLRRTESIEKKVDTLIKAEIPSPPVKFVVAITAITPATQGETNMADPKKVARKATVDFQLLDNGTARLTATPVDAAGLATKLPDGTPPASWTSSDPGLVITLDPADPSGLTAIASPATPPVLVTGAIPTVTANFTSADGSVKTITGAGAGIDVVAGEAGSFTVQES